MDHKADQSVPGVVFRVDSFDRRAGNDGASLRLPQTDTSPRPQQQLVRPRDHDGIIRRLGIEGNNGKKRTRDRFSLVVS